MDTDINMLWHSTDEARWTKAYQKYWDGGYIKPDHMELEREMDALNPMIVRELCPHDWYEFLRDKYFRWKYTSPNRYATTTKALNTYIAVGKLAELNNTKHDLFTFDKHDISKGLRTASQVPGLGTAGASGLLAILFPADFATVDQFAVKALSAVPELAQDIRRMNPENLAISDGVKLIQIMRQKAKELQTQFGQLGFWTPRRIDMVLWAARTGGTSGRGCNTVAG